MIGVVGSVLVFFWNFLSWPVNRMQLHHKLKLQAGDAAGLVKNMRLPLEPESQVVMARFAAILS